MMTIKSSGLFYLFRRVFVLLCLMVLSCYYGQVTLVGDVVVINNTQDSAIYISGGTYVYHLKTSEKQIHKKVCKTPKTVTIKSTIPAKSASAKNQQAESLYHYKSGRNNDTLASTSASKTCFTSNNDHYKKLFTSIIIWDSATAFSLFGFETFPKKVQREIEFPKYSFRIRPPPATLNAI